MIKKKFKEIPKDKHGYPPEHHSKCGIHDEFCEICFFTISAYQEHMDDKQKGGKFWHNFNIMKYKINKSLDEMQFEYYKLQRIIEKHHWQEYEL